ncbi:MAG: hypothetical protein KC535_02025 [Nanoarchaeota archaeon]|nr:hypothetical protein [Nanoarchaeota archaeon]
MSEDNQTKEYLKGIAILIIIAIIGFSAKGVILGNASSRGIQATGDVVADEGNVQYATLKIENYQYVTEPKTLKAGVPVVMTVDLDSVYGCARDVVIREYGVRKYVKEGDNIIRFTPTESGSLPVACSMNMVRGNLDVE